jgi:membrane protease YdiL (CAAX protease family)
MLQQILSFALFIQLPSALFVYVDAKKRGMIDYWLWVIGVALFMPFFLPFYILLRPRERFIYCPNCNVKNSLPVEKCRNCEFEIQQENQDPVRGNWTFSDALAIYVLSVFTIPMSIMGLGVALGLIDQTSKSWFSLFFFSLAGSIVLLGLPIWFVLKVCKRPLADIGLKRENLYRNIIIGVVMVAPVLFLDYIAEEFIVKAASTIAPSKSEVIQEMQDNEHANGVEMWPKNPDEIGKLSGSMLLVIIMGPLGEEILFRGIAYTGLRRKRGKWKALIISSIVFALAHVQLIHFIPILISGIALAYLFQRTGSLIPSITFHVLYNLSLAVFWYIQPSIYT